MSCAFVNEEPVGGFTDGEPCGMGLRELNESGELTEMLNLATR
jgi:hypothetical protein